MIPSETLNWIKTVIGYTHRASRIGVSLRVFMDVKHWSVGLIKDFSLGLLFFLTNFDRKWQPPSIKFAEEVGLEVDAAKTTEREWPRFRWSYLRSLKIWEWRTKKEWDVWKRLPSCGRLLHEFFCNENDRFSTQTHTDNQKQGSMPMDERAIRVARLW